MLTPKGSCWPSDCISWLSFEARLTPKYIWNFLWFDRYLPKSCQENWRKKSRYWLLIRIHQPFHSQCFHVNKVSGKIPPFNKLLLLNWHCTFLFVWSVVIMDHQRNGGACFFYFLNAIFCLNIRIVFYYLHIEERTE